MKRKLTREKQKTIKSGGEQLHFSFYYEMTEDTERGNLGTHQSIVKVRRG